MFPEAGSAHQTLNKLVSNEGMAVLVPAGTEHGTWLTGTLRPEAPPSPASAPPRPEADFGPWLAGEVGCSGWAHATSMHITASHGSIASRTLKMSYFITRLPPAEEDVKAWLVPAERGLPMGNTPFSLPFKSLVSLPPAHTHSFSDIYYRYRFPNLQHMMQEQTSEQCYTLKPSRNAEMWESSSPHNKVTGKSGPGAGALAAGTAPDWLSGRMSGVKKKIQVACPCVPGDCLK